MHRPSTLTRPAATRTGRVRTLLTAHAAGYIAPMRPPTPALLALVPSGGAAPVADKRAAVQLVSTLTLVSIVLIICTGVIAIMLVRLHRRRLVSARVTKRRRRPPADPWFESARRVPDLGGPKSREFRLPGMGESRSGADDDTVDLDPDELDEGDIDGDPPPPSTPPPPPPTPPPNSPKPPPPAPGSRGG